MFYKEEKRDLFGVSDNYYLVQCISVKENLKNKIYRWIFL